MLQPSAKKLRPVIGLVMLVVSLTGCGEGVREDRTVDFSRDGSQVAFQHGKEGVYVAGADGKGLTKIFQPDETVLATSRPLSSPTDGRLIFATAHLPDGQQPPAALNVGPEPLDGRIAWAMPVRYTCWLRSEPQGDQPPEVKKLFEASCGHLGYVSGGLAIRWSRDGQRVVYCASLPNDVSRHSVFEFDIASQKSRQVFPHAATAVICDWTPGGSHLVCVVGDAVTAQEANQRVDELSGTWIGSTTDEKSWWHVPESGQLAEGALPSVIEMLRASRPAWTRDDANFAFVSQTRPAAAGAKISHKLQRVEFASRKITLLAEADGPITNLYWSPDGQRLGYVQQSASGEKSLQVLDPQASPKTVPISRSVRQFAGFDASGTNLAYAIASQPPLAPEAKHWALLLIPTPARDSVWIAPADASAPGKEILSGMHVTFPNWSPTEEKLSLWLTFTPRYQSLLSLMAQAGLWPGDPAVTIDSQSGAVSWMAVSPQEELQVGHYYLLKRDNNEAWRWYAQARQKLPAHKPPADWQDFIRRMGAPENSHAFESICLRRLGRDTDADAKWAEFEQNFFPPPPKPAAPGEPTPAVDFLASLLGSQTELAKPLIHDLFVAEVFLSVDGLEEALLHFRKPIGEAAPESAAFSQAVVLAQLMLLANDHAGYVAHCGDVVAPLALKLYERPGRTAENNLLVQFGGGLCLAPLFRSEFVAQLPADKLQQHAAVWQALADKNIKGVPAVAIDLVMRATALALKDTAETARIEQRISSNPSSQEVLGGRPIDEATANWIDFAQQVAHQP